MSTGMMYVILLTITALLNSATAAEPSIARSVFLPREFDPYADGYIQKVTRMTVSELMHMPQLTDTELLYQLANNIDSVLVSSNRANPSNLFDSTIDEQLEHQGNIEGEWEDLMAGGPASVQYISSVMTVASKRDFPLTPNFDYKFIKYPNSFRTTLVQLSNEMQRALYNAHTGMDKILLNMRQIPTQIKTALKITTQGSIAMNKAMLPRTLASIGQYANQSASVARDALEKFEQLQHFLQEIVLAARLTEGIQQNASEALTLQAQQLENDKNKMNIVLNNLTNEFEVAKQDLIEARKKYQTAILNVPGGQWDSAAWEAFVNTRPTYFCDRWWCWRRCAEEREKIYTEFTAEAKRKAQQALEILKMAENRYKELFNQQIQQQNSISASIGNLATINFNALSVNQTIAILLDATAKISLLQGQWSRITRFFSKIAIQTGHTQNVILERFLGVIADYEAAGSGITESDKVFFIELLVDSATDIERDSHLLFLMAKTYSDVSHEYMVDQIAEASSFLSLQTDADREAQLQLMANKTQTIANDVMILATERKRNYELMNIARQQEYEQYIQEGIAQQQLSELNGIGIGRR